MSDLTQATALLRALHPGPLQPEQAISGAACTIGRDARHAEVLIRRPDVSRLHARIERADDGQWQIIDLGSTNGTQLNGRRIESATRLQHGDVIGLGRAQVPDFEFVLSAALERSRRVELAGSGPWMIGRNLNHPLSLPADPVTSLDHARLQQAEDGLWIEDLGSRNGTWLNGRRIRRGRVEQDSQITIGSNLLKIEFSQHRTVVEIEHLQRALGIEIRGLVSARNEPPLSLAIEPGRLQLLCLPDPVSRSHLIEALLGLHRPLAGRLAFSEPVLDDQLEHRRDRVGEVHPDCQPGPRQRLDHYLEDLARLALAKDVSSGHRHELIRTTLEALELSPAATRRWQQLAPLERELGRIAGALLHRPGLLLVDLQAGSLSGADQLHLIERLRSLASSSLSILLISDQLLDAMEDTEIISPANLTEPVSAGAMISPRPHRASLIRQRVLTRRSLAGWLERPSALLEALALPLLLTAALWLALPEREGAKLGLIAVLVSVALASAFQVSRWQPGLVYLTRRHLLPGDALVGLTGSALVVGSAQAILALLTLAVLDAPITPGLPPAMLALVLPAAAAGLACGLAAGRRPFLAMTLVASLVTLQITAAALFQANGESGGLLLTRLAELSPVHWAGQLYRALVEDRGLLRPLAFLLGQALLFLGLARVCLRDGS
jgi:pSer/pThr/pTyr-binding forkhead associated (FHA) protein/energy-coupling factor transporter ATP-binding protein EcfA2